MNTFSEGEKKEWRTSRVSTFGRNILMGRKKNTEDRKCEYALKGRKKRLKKTEMVSMLWGEEKKRLMKKKNGEYALERIKKDWKEGWVRFEKKTNKTDEREKWWVRF